MTRQVLTALVALSWCVAPLNPIAMAETIHFKDGRTLEAQIIRQTDKTVTVDWYGVPLTYWRDAIVGIEKGAAGPGPQAPSVRPATPSPREAPAAAAPSSPPEPRQAADPPAPTLPQAVAPPAVQAPVTEPQALAVFESQARGVRVAYPEGWAATVPDGPSPYVVTIQRAPSGEQASDRIAPVVIELLKYAGASGRLGLEAGAPGDEVVGRFLEQFTESGGRVLRKEPFTVQGAAGWLAEAEGTDPLGVTHHMLLYLAAENDVLAVLFCQAPPEAFEAHRALFHEVIMRLEPFVYVPGS
jgi:hypothetical protein